MHRPSMLFLAFAVSAATIGCGSGDPEPDRQPKPIARPAPVPQSREEPPQQAEPSTPPPPRSADEPRTPQGQGWKKVVWLNGFGRAEADRVWKAMEGTGEFSEVMDGGGGNDQRIPLECKYHGADLKLSLNQLLRDLALRHHFTEAHLKHHIEVHRDR